MSPVPHALSLHLVVDGKAVTPETAGAVGLVLRVHERGDRAWVEVRNDGARLRVIEQVAFEHRFPDGGPTSKVPRPKSSVPSRKSTGQISESEDAGEATLDLGPGTLDALDIIVYGPRAFVRGREAGYAATIETPEASAEAFPGGVRFWYTPHEALAAGGVYESRALVSVPTSLTGFRLAPAQGPCYTGKHRIPPWAPSPEPLDLGEIQAVRRAVAAESPPADGPVIQYGEAGRPGLAGAAPDRVLADIDFAADLGIEYDLLSDDLGAWTGDDPSKDVLRRVFAHAEGRGVKLGIRVCTNAPSSLTGAPWRPDRPEWAILPADGKPHAARCLGHAEFVDWLSGEIERRLAAWPIRLVAFDLLVIQPCHASDHGHPPGDASRYAQARGAETLLRRVKERRPHVKTATGRGWNGYAPRFARWTDLHDFGDEAVMPFPDPSLVRVINNRHRKERLLVQHFRFLPAAAQQGSVFLSAGDVPERGSGHRPVVPPSAALRYVFLQSLATCPNLSLSGLRAWVGEEARGNRTEEEIAADRAFLKRWTRFARENGTLLREPRCLTAPDVEVDNVEAYAHLARAEGFVFVVNPNARVARVRFEADGSLEWERLHPEGAEPAAVVTGETLPPGGAPWCVLKGASAIQIITPPHTVSVHRVRRRGVDDLRTLRAAATAPRRDEASAIFRERPLDVESWAGAYFPARPGIPAEWRRAATAGGFAAEATVALREEDLTADLTLGVHLIQPERAATPVVHLNGRTVRATPVVHRPPRGGSPDVAAGWIVPSAEIRTAAAPGENRLRIEFAPAAAAGADGWRTLFNGRDLEGWEALGTAVWRVEDGVLVGTQDGDPKKSGLLATRDAFRDFELELEFRIDEFRTYNSGVYLRNDPGTQARTGYQVNIGSGAFAEYCGGLYLKDWRAKGDEQDAVRRKGEWNALRLRAEGPRFVVDLNGVRVADYTDPAPDPKHLQKGVLALQTYGAENHAGWVKFRNLRIRELP